MPDKNNANNDPISKALGINPLDRLNSIEKTVKNLEAQSLIDSANVDFQTARKNIHNIIESGTQALDELLMIASQSQHPRAYEVISVLIKTLIDANKDLLELQRKIRDLSDSEQPISGPRTINNNLIITTAQLTKMIENARSRVIDQNE